MEKKKRGKKNSRALETSNTPITIIYTTPAPPPPPVWKRQTKGRRESRRVDGAASSRKWNWNSPASPRPFCRRKGVSFPSSRSLPNPPFSPSSFFSPRNLHPRPAFLSPSIGTTHRLGWIHLASISKGRSFFEKASFFQDSWIKNHVDYLSDFLIIRLLIFRSLLNLKFWKMKRQVIY